MGVSPPKRGQQIIPDQKSVGSSVNQQPLIPNIPRARMGSEDQQKFLRQDSSMSPADTSVSSRSSRSISTVHHDTSYIPPSLQPLLSFPVEAPTLPSINSPSTENASKDFVGNVEEGGRNSRLLYDKSGHLRYLGESSALSLLAQSRKVFLAKNGQSAFTQDPQRFHIVDSPGYVSTGWKNSQLPAKEIAFLFIQQFEEHVNGAVYVFDMDDFRDEIQEVYRNPLKASPKTICLLNLVMSIGSIFLLAAHQQDTLHLPLKDVYLCNFILSKIEVFPRIFFANGLHLLTDSSEDGELWIVQAYLLVFLFYQISCQRNASWIHLGVSIRHAQALGLNRKYVNLTFNKRDCSHRRKIWRSLYFNDRICSSYMGRPITIDDRDWDDMPDYPNFSEESSSVQYQTVKVTEILGEILHRVYTSEKIGTLEAKNLASKLKSWTVNLPENLQAGIIFQTSQSSIHSTTSPTSGSAQPYNVISLKEKQSLLVLHLTHLHTVLLLCRPFFFHVISQRKNSSQVPEKPEILESFDEYMKACIQSSLLSNRLVEVFFLKNEQPIRDHAIIYFIFNAGLILGLQVLNQIYYGFGSNCHLLVYSIKSSILILQKYGKIDPTAERYHKIIVNVYEALDKDGLITTLSNEMAFVNFNDLVQNSNYQDGLLLTVSNVENEITAGYSNPTVDAPLSFTPSNSILNPNSVPTPNNATNGSNSFVPTDAADIHTLTGSNNMNGSNKLPMSQQSSMNNISSLLEFDQWLFPSFEYDMDYSKGGILTPEQGDVGYADDSIQQNNNDGSTMNPEEISRNVVSSNKERGSNISGGVVQVKSSGFTNEFLHSENPRQGLLIDKGY